MSSTASICSHSASGGGTVLTKPDSPYTSHRSMGKSFNTSAISPLYPNPWRKKCWGPFTAFRTDGLPDAAQLFRKTKQALEEGALVLPITRGNKVFMERTGGGGDQGKRSHHIKWLTQPQIEDHFQLQYHSDKTAFATRSKDLGQEEAVVGTFELIYLGRTSTGGGGNTEFFAIDLSQHQQPSTTTEEAGRQEQCGFGELRTFVKENHDLLGTEQACSVSRAGYALALGNWAKGVSFCPSCGSPTRSSQIGTRKECTNRECGKKQYPRLDPVAIMLVVSEDEQHALLASPKYASGRMLTCTAGFIEQCETIEEVSEQYVRVSVFRFLE